VVWIFAGLLAAPGLASTSAPAEQGGAQPRIETNRLWDVLPPPAHPGGSRATLLRAGEAIGARRIVLSGVAIEGARLVETARATPLQAGLEAALRDALGRPVDLADLLLFLDDVLAELPPERPVYVTPGRARRHGILLHPDDVYTDSPRRYGEHGPLSIDPPQPQREDLPPARDGDPPGPGWAMRYRNPLDEQARLAALTRYTGDGDFERRLRGLVDQLRAQGAEVWVNSTLRSPERGYLMWGAFVLSRTGSERAFRAEVRRLERANREWGLDVPITWQPQGDWRRTREAAREMAETYEVVFATEAGARGSSHYGGGAVDLVAVDLPRRLVVEGDEGARREFDLSGAGESLDLSLTPSLVEWIEAHLGMKKLRADYPHWDDARR